jgi:hypothetical protein
MAYKLRIAWPAREESAGACAVRLAQMLEAFAQIHPAFGRWNKQAWTRDAANLPAWRMPPEVDELTRVFEEGRAYKDKPRKPWPEAGYFVSAWNGLDGLCGASLGVNPGSHDHPNMVFPNWVNLRVDKRNPQLGSADVLRSALLGAVSAWEPHYGSVVTWDYWKRSFGEQHYPVFRSGWMTYLAPQYARLVALPAQAIAERVPGGGLLLLATTEQFDVDNPAHLAAADAIQLTLDPLRDTELARRDQERWEYFRRKRRPRPA